MALARRFSFSLKVILIGPIILFGQQIVDPIVPYSVTGYKFAQQVPVLGRHLGEDVNANLGVGTPIRAVADGVVILSKKNRPGYGQYVVISHSTPSTFVSVYGHLSRQDQYPLHGLGQIKQGDIVGYVGSTEENGGWVPHLHFGIYRKAPDGTYHYWGYAPNTSGDDVDLDASGKVVGGLFTKPSTFIESSPSSSPFRKLTNAISRDYFPTFRPDGTKILFTSNRNNVARANDIWDMNPDGSLQSELVHIDISTPPSFGDPGLFPNVKEFIGNTGDLAVIEAQDFHEVMHVSLSAATSFPIIRTVEDGPDAFFSDLLLVPGGLNVTSFVYSNATQNAAWIGYVGNGSQFQLRTAPFNQLIGLYAYSTGTILLTTSTDGSQNGISFSPNGQQLVAALCLNSCSASHKGTDLYVLDAASGQIIQRLTTDGDTGTSSQTPRWSPNGQRITFVSNKTGNNEIWTIHPDGTAAQQITSNGLDNSGPSWSPDSTSLVFAINNNGSYAIWLASGVN